MRSLKGHVLGYIDYSVIVMYNLDQVFDLQRAEVDNPVAALEMQDGLRYVSTDANLSMYENCE